MKRRDYLNRRHNRIRRAVGADSLPAKIYATQSFSDIEANVKALRADVDHAERRELTSRIDRQRVYRGQQLPGGGLAGPA